MKTEIFKVKSSKRNLQAFVTVEGFGWDAIVVSFKVSKRRGQTITASVKSSDKLLSWVDNYDSYSAIRFATKRKYFESAVECVNYCNKHIIDIYKSIDFDSDMKLITKELLNILK